MAAINKKSLFYIILVTICAFIVVALSLYFYDRYKSPAKIDNNEAATEYDKELKKMNDLRSKLPDMTGAEKQAEINQMDQLRAKLPSMSQEEIQKEIDAMNKLRSQ